MFGKATILFTLLGITAQVAHATPPACVIAAVNTQDDPSDLNAVCSGSAAKEVGQYICKNCGENTDIAARAFADVCSGAGADLADSAVSCSSADSGSQTDSGTPTEQTGGTGGATGTAASSTSSTSNVAATPGIHLVGMGAAAVFGAILAL